MPGVFGPEPDVQEAMVGQFPDSFGAVGEERRRRAEQVLVPGQRCGIVGDGYACEQVHGHAGTLSASAHHPESHPTA
jgi:hypothetical protein